MANKEELLARLQEEKPAMEVRDLSFAYGSNQILKDISLMIKEGKITTIMGANGCGKSTLLQLIAGLDQDYEGKILFNQVKIEDIKDYRQLVISFVYQNYQLIDYLSVKDNCLFYCHLKGIKVVEKQLQELLEIFELNELVNQKVKKFIRWAKTTRGPYSCFIMFKSYYFM